MASSPWHGDESTTCDEPFAQIGDWLTSFRTAPGGASGLGGTLRISIDEVGPGAKAKVAVLGMKGGYKAQLDDLETLLAR